MPHTRVFGYGSLVHTGTHGFQSLGPGTLMGWERVWLHRTDRPFARLSVHPRPGARLRGLVADVAPAQWADLDLREAGYDKHSVTAETGSGALDACLYVIPDAPKADPRPILMSYLETVLAGFHTQDPQDGIEDFFATTTGWDGPVLDDCAAPHYPRHRPPAPDLRQTINQCLAERGVPVVSNQP
jgi:hypothetical protein